LRRATEAGTFEESQTLNPLDHLAGILAAQRLLVIGGLNVDQHLRVDSLPGDDGSARVTDYSVAFGGHAGNCACQLARLGAKVAVLGAVGADADGVALISDLQACGVNTEFIRSISEIATGRVVIPSFPDCRYMLMYRGANDYISLESIGEAIAEFEAIVLFDPLIEFADSLFEMLSRLRMKVYWNPGGLLANSPATNARLRYADVVIMNCVEARAAFVNLIDAPLLRRLNSDRPGFRLIESLGPEGARLHAQGRTLQVGSFPARAVDETGAGDAFTAGFVAFDSIGFNETTTLRLANAAGACAIEGTGARAAQADLATLAQRWDLVGDISAALASLATGSSGGERAITH
jgi:ribokinase